MTLRADCQLGITSQLRQEGPHAPNAFVDFGATTSALIRENGSATSEQPDERGHGVDRPGL